MQIKVGLNKSEFARNNFRGSAIYSSQPQPDKPFTELSRTNKLIHNRPIYNNIEKPLKNTSYDGTSFKGSFLSTNVIKYAIKEQDGTVQKALNKYGETFGDQSKTYLENLINKVSQNVPKFYKGADLKYEDGVLKIPQKSTLREIGDNIIYPFTQMPLDLVNATLELTEKIFKNKNISKKARTAIPALERNYQRNILENEVVGINGYLQSFQKAINEGKEKDFKPFKSGHKMLDSNTGKYSSSTERFLARITSGTVSALFLATDAYNLSSLINNNSKEAEKDSKKRFRQEAGRVGFAAYLTLVVMGALKKYTNNSLLAAVGVGGAATLIAEIVGRKAVGNKILPMTQKQSVNEHQKEQEQAKIEEQKKQKDKTSFLSNLKAEKNDKKQKEDANISAKAKLLAFAGLYWAGAFIMSRKNTQKLLKPALNSVKNFYNNITFTEITTSKKAIDKSLKRLEDMGFEGLSKNYRSALENFNKTVNHTDQNTYSLGISRRKKVKAFIDSGLSFPFKMVHKIMMAPVSLFNQVTKAFNKSNSIETLNKLNDKGLISKFSKISGAFIDEDKLKANKIRLTNSQLKKANEMLSSEEKLNELYLNHLVKELNNKGLSKFFEKTGTKDIKTAENLLKLREDLHTARNGLDFIQKNELKTNPELKELLNNKIISSFDNETKAKYASTDLQTWNKFLGSGITGVFLIFDNYNMVMKKTGGKDKDMAQQKGRERAVQEVSRNIFSTYFIKLVSDMFKGFYHSSLFGVGTVIAAQVYGYETLTRKAVGLPLKKSSKTEIEESEKKNEAKKGFWGKYYRFMSYVTGKKSLSSRIPQKNEKQPTVLEANLYFKSYQSLKKHDKENNVFSKFS